MNPAEFLQEMKRNFPDTGYDEEISHQLADRLMCKLLRQMGYGAGIEIFEDADKWYS